VTNPRLRSDHIGAVATRSSWQQRVLDLTIVIATLPLTLPLCGVIAGLVRLSSGSPVLFSQLRLGIRGTVFVMHKFRTMYNGSADTRNADGTTSVAEADSRITPLGRFLRRTSLDELPQIINVLEGTMSVVGPRPELPDGLQGYSEADWERLSVRPGLTSLAIVRGRKEVGLRERRALDIEYVRNRRLRTDLRLIAQPVLMIISGKGAR
jgi:lipopolysaccharide/colanic/teichoic acid biosynthesis glycosyltransferase